MGCEARIVLYSSSPRHAAAAARAAFDRIAEVDAALSDWRRDSESERLAAAADERPLPASFEASDLFVEALRCALCIQALSEGRFDPTLGAVTRLWREHRGRGTAPSAAELDGALAASGADGVALADRRVTFHRRGLRFDFGGVGKGFAADEAVQVLARSGAPSSLVAIAGDIAVGEAPPGRSGWRLGIASRPEVIDLPPGAGASTSGDSEQWYEVEGERTSHIVDPRSGVGVRHAPQVTVIVEEAGPCPSCGAAATADALATAVSACDAADQARFIARLRGVEVILTPLKDAPESPPDPGPSR